MKIRVEGMVTIPISIVVDVDDPSKAEWVATIFVREIASFEALEEMATDTLGFEITDTGPTDAFSDYSQRWAEMCTAELKKNLDKIK